MSKHYVNVQFDVSQDVFDLIEHAAKLGHQTIESFVVAAVRDAARRALDNTGTLVLPTAAQEHFVKALECPPWPAPALKRAFRQRLKLLDND